MALPPYDLDCNRCGHRWQSTASAGTSVKCPACLKRGEIHTRRMPMGRPRTLAAATAAAAGDDDGLTEAWAAEAPPGAEPDADAGQACPACGRPMHWTGAHTAVICASSDHPEPAWEVSGGARKRAAEHAAAIAHRAARVAAVIDLERERERRAEADRAAVELARRKGAMLRELEAVAGNRKLHPDDLPAVEWFAEQVRKADTGGRLDELAERWAEEDIRPRHWWQAPVAGELEGDDDYDDDDGQGDDDTGPGRQMAFPAVTAAAQLAAPAKTLADTYWDQVAAAGLVGRAELLEQITGRRL